MRIALIGFMGAGKSSVAQYLAKDAGLRIAETDDRVIQQSHGKPISDIFQDEGEAYFRERETEALRLILQEEVEVISCGGGVVTRSENIEMLREAGYTLVYLDAPFDLLCERVGGDPSRPLFRDKEKAKELYAQRETLYRTCADLIISILNRPPQFFSRVLLQLFSSSRDGESGSLPLSLFCVVGDPICHSRSPLIHNVAFSKEEVGKYYFAWRHQESGCGHLCALLRNGALAGASVTMPLKEVLLGQVDELTHSAQAIGALNTLYLQNEKLVGENTDWAGIVSAIEERTSFVDKKVGVFGAGGTARAAAYAVREKGGVLHIFNRTQEKAMKLAVEFGGVVGSFSDEAMIRSCDILIQTTSVGMKPNEEQSIVPPECFRPGQVVLDLVYSPKETLFLSFAKKAGAEVIYGDRVFLWQGVRQSEIFSGGKAPVEIMEKALSL
ncbi:MAG: shikimate dehydrogenase [Bdellovibrionales bacterium]|nr:shikimate dehydrogenase [Bdellovibrionales bacterium]